MFDSDVATLYHYENRRINETVKGNIERMNIERFLIHKNMTLLFHTGKIK